MKIAFIFTAFNIVALLSCQKNTYVHQFDKDELQISISTAGGWCSGSDSMTISKNKSVYVYRTTCKSDAKIINSTTSISDWNELTNLLDSDRFKSVNLNSCGICYDGIDETVSIKSGAFYHSIRYDNLNDAKLNVIRPFIDQLRIIRDNYKAQFQK